MNFFNLDIKKIAVIIGFIVIPLLTINMQRNSEGGGILQPFVWMSGLFQMGYSSFSSGVRGTTAMYLDLIGIKKTNQDLLKENAELRAQLGSMTELQLENERLNELLAFKQKTNMELLAAKVIGKDLLPDHNTITINRGSQHGLKKSMAALTVAGAVGYVFRVQDFTSQILLLTDRYSAIDAIVQRSRARGIIEGFSKEACRMRYLRRSDDVKTGDLIVTSGLDNIFPKGFPIGTVTEVNRSEYGVTQDVEIAPFINSTNMEEIFIVLNSHSEDFSPPEPDSSAENDTVTSAASGEKK
ncbi:MAG: rod shape-determining protein MreC [Bdellovibrionales bacterium]|nr:rod shape-determining protein MreC [Bdellovibrionales bacterium]